MANRQGWETSDFPIVCETCLGDNPYVRMQKQPYGEECKSCNRPFTVFRWNPGRVGGSRVKKTEICQTCAKIKNCCQTCILDLQYGLPIQVRDSILDQKESIPTSEINRQYYVSNMEQKMQGKHESAVDYGRVDQAAKEILKRVSRKEPYDDRNKPHICSFFVKGNCNRAETCPFRHEMPKPQSELSKQNIKDRFNGTNDPVAEKILKKVDKLNATANSSGVLPPEDRGVKSLYILGIDEEINELDLRQHFTTFGAIKSITVIQKAKGAFVNFVSRDAAEDAAANANHGLVIKGKHLKFQWGRSKGGSKRKSAIPKPPRNAQVQQSRPSNSEAVGSDEPKEQSSMLDQIIAASGPPPPGQGRQTYASMSGSLGSNK